MRGIICAIACLMSLLELDASKFDDFWRRHELGRPMKMLLAIIVAIAATTAPLLHAWAQTVIVIPRQDSVTYGIRDVTQYSLEQIIEACAYDDYCKQLYAGGPYYSDDRLPEPGLRGRKQPAPIPAQQREIVNVKYRGPVDLAPFKCDSISRSSFIQRVCYDDKNAYMLINLSGTWYHYCKIDPATVLSLLAAPPLWASSLIPRSRANSTAGHIASLPTHEQRMPPGERGGRLPPRSAFCWRLRS